MREWVSVRGSWVQEGGRDSLVDGVFGDVDEEEGKHVGNEERAGSLKVVEECGLGFVVGGCGGGATR